MQRGVRIALRDGIHLSATLYLPTDRAKPAPVIVTLTPYSEQAHHDLGIYFATHGYPFLTVDVRGRGNSEGVFEPLVNEARDGFDVVEWAARQSYCNGHVTMWGGSYAGYVQWVTAKELPPHLATIVPVASPCLGVDFPISGNIAKPYVMQWLTLVSGRTVQDRVFADQRFWSRSFRQWFESGTPFRELDAFLGSPSAIFQEWISHPRSDEYWDTYNPTADEYAKVLIPILTITGTYDGDQPGALMHYRRHLEHSSAATRAQHCLVIGPWNHAGTRNPSTEFCGLKVGPASLVDLPKLHIEWYAWTMRNGPRPQFLQKNVAYYVMGAEKWRYADTLDDVTARSIPFYLQSTCNPDDVFKSGSLAASAQRSGEPDHYLYDPLDVSLAELESSIDPESRVDDRMLYASIGKQLIYHSAPFENETEISGFFKLVIWLSLDQPDTDICASVYEVSTDGTAIRLTSDWMRARYREGLRNEKLIGTAAPLRYELERFMFVSRQIGKRSRLRLVIGPIHSIYVQKNYNSGGVVAEQSASDARPVRVRLFHDESFPSALHVPYGKPEA
jgi:uncharacterized protein